MFLLCFPFHAATQYDVFVVSFIYPFIYVVYMAFLMVRAVHTYNFFTSIAGIEEVAINFSKLEGINVSTNKAKFE